MKLTPHVFLLFISFILAYLTYNMVSPFKSLPSPIFGGDMYYQLGSIIHILEGGNPFESSSIFGAVPGYLPLFSILVSLFAIFTGLDAFHALIYFSVVLAFIIPLIWFFLIKKFVKNDYLALLCVLLFFLAIENPLGFPIIKYTNFTYLVVFPVFLFFLYEVYVEFNLKNVALLAIFYSLLAISHFVVFIVASIIFMFFLCYRVYLSLEKKQDIFLLLKEKWKEVSVFLTISIPLVFLYFYQPIFMYSLKTAYDRSHMDIPNFAVFDVQFWFILDTIQFYFLNFSNIATFFFIFAFISLAMNTKKWMNNPQLTFLFIAFFAGFCATFSYFITEPLLHINLINTYIRSLAFGPLLFLCGVYFLDQQNLLEKLQNLQVPVFFILFTILFYIVIQNGAITRENNVFFANAFQPLPPHQLSMMSYIKENTSVNDVFLSAKELGFALNALTGRKLVTNRWAHQNDPYTDMPQRDLDAAIILYGSNSKEKLQLLKKYNIKYLYWDSNWIFVEYNIGGPNNSVLYPFDPLITFDTPVARASLEKNNIKYINLTTWLDPSVKVWYVKQFPILMISYENYRSIDRPWHSNLDPYLEEVWNYNKNGQKIAVLYKINYS